VIASGDDKKVAVGVVTKNRPEMLACLLSSFQQMRTPNGWTVIFIVVENDVQRNLDAQIDTFRAAVSCDVIYDLEPEQGIPFARNAVVDRAVALGADVLTFVDDDERVAEDWLDRLITGLWSRDLDLVGGPLRIEAETPSDDPWQGAVLAFLQAKAAKNERNRALKVAQGADQKLDAYTNNWALRLAFAEQHNLRFDTALRFTGGSDTQFSIAARKAGGRKGWVPEAVVYDRIPDTRLTLGYHYRRTRDQARNGAILRKKPFWKTPFFMLARGIEACALILTTPFAGRVAIVRAVHNLALADGRLRGSLGFKSKLYAPK